MVTDSDSSCFETTYSQDERIGNYLKDRKKSQKIQKDIIAQERKQYFDSIKTDLKARGLEILRWSHLKIKFSFNPSQVVVYISKKTKFYCSLKYLPLHNKWILKKDTLPTNYKMAFYKYFYTDNYLAVDDENVVLVIQTIIKKLQSWATMEEQRLQRRYKKYLDGEDIFLDSEDEEIFLNEEERKELHKKRKKILKRMLPPRKRRRHIM